MCFVRKGATICPASFEVASMVMFPVSVVSASVSVVEALKRAEGILEGRLCEGASPASLDNRLRLFGLSICSRISDISVLLPLMIMCMKLE